MDTHPMDTASPPAVVAEGLAFSYASGGGVQRADLTLGAGTMTAVEGPSGSGKSTLLALLGLILSPAAGSLHIDGAATHALPAAERDLLRRRSIGIVLQDLGTAAVPQRLGERGRRLRAPSGPAPHRGPGPARRPRHG
ncbi:ATP-binding cassette domain-containing protein [Streptomyces sp. SID9913]|uniref:ATP-binding cassette domain-containing protein n=1 Tax=Streptomyces sp. SID9913 TaxID=2706117 RepID=UPI0023B2F070|nr:ATP-binding cassette domain-containing protein [Streptomyces sp. SID9913]